MAIARLERCLRYCSFFVLCQSVLIRFGALACFDPQWPNFKMLVDNATTKAKKKTNQQSCEEKEGEAWLIPKSISKSLH
jgi:hypothetical protein